MENGEPSPRIERHAHQIAFNLDHIPSNGSLIEIKDSHSNTPSIEMNRIHRRNSQSTSDVARAELLWTDRIDTMMNEWIRECDDASKKHAYYANAYRYLFHIMGIPAAIIPMCLATLHINSCEALNAWIVVMLVLTTILNVTIGFINPSKTAENHYTFSALYSELSIAITTELIKAQRFRIGATIFIQQISDKLTNLHSRAPPT